MAHVLRISISRYSRTRGRRKTADEMRLDSQIVQNRQNDIEVTSSWPGETAGSCGSQKARFCGYPKAGSCGSQKAGSCGSQKAGSCGSQNASSCGSQKAGYCVSQTVGSWGSQTAGSCGSQSAGSCEIQTAGSCDSHKTGSCEIVMKKEIRKLHCRGKMLSSIFLYLLLLKAPLYKNTVSQVNIEILKIENVKGPVYSMHTRAYHNSKKKFLFIE